MGGLLEEKTREYLRRIKKRDRKINAFLEVKNEKELLAEARTMDKKVKKGRLYGMVIAVKSNINVKGMSCSCASKTLENYKSSYDATVIKRIKLEDGLIIGMTNCDEFAAGSSGELSAFGATENPLIKGHVAGGSSSGSAAAVAAGFCDVALGSDTGGSIRVPASFCGVVGIKPSYGAVSRHGLVDLSMSLDQIGALAKTVEDASLVLDVIKGEDEKDTKSVRIPKISLKNPGKIVVGICDLSKVKVDKKIEKAFNLKIDEIISRFGWKRKNVNIEHIALAVETYHPLLWTEFFSATRRFDGRKYGKKIEDVCGEEVLRRILGGKEVARAELRGRFYHKALAVKEIIKKDFERILKQVDCVIMPSVPVFPWKIGGMPSLENFYATDALAIPANLAEICSVSVPVAEFEKKSIGIQIMCGKGDEAKMLSIAREIERLNGKPQKK